MNPDTLKGQYYKAAPTLIDQQLDEAFESERGPGATPRISEDRSLEGIITPVYDYEYAAPCAGWAYDDLAQSGFPDVFIIPVQADKTAVTEETFTTPYDYVRVDQTFQRELHRKTGAKYDNDVFTESDLVQSQLPLLQYTFSSEREAIKIAPIALSAEKTLKSFAIDIKEVAVDLDRSFRIIVPTNIIQYGTEYNFVPFTQERLQKIQDLDKTTLNRIRDNEPLSLLEHVSSNHLSMNNYLGVVLALLLIDPDTVNVEQYYTTHDIDGDETSIVSFAAITLE
jgi:AmmeMemoRadiSam system protein B